MRSWSYPQWTVASVGAVVTALLTGVPTEMIGNPWFVRMTPVLWWNRPVWLLTAVLAGLLLATYVGATSGEGADGPGTSRRGGIGGALGYLAIGCPVCNKIVVVALGTSGALSWFAPIQPLLAIGSLVLLAVALRTRLRSVTACPTTLRAALGLPAPSRR